MIVGGWDPEGGGQIYGVPISGTLVQQDWTTDGSGSTYIWGYLDSAYRYTLVAQPPTMSSFACWKTSRVHYKFLHHWKIRTDQ